MSSSSTAPLSLADLIRPLTDGQFIENYLLAGQHHLSSADAGLVNQLLAIDELRNFPQFIQRLDRVDLFGPNGFRSAVPGRAALDFYQRGDTLYVSHVEQFVPTVMEVCAPIAAALGVHVRQISCEVFAARQRGVTSLHYDHDTNFHILLSGKKRWRVQRNRHIVNPLWPNHRPATPREEAVAERLPFPATVADLDDPAEIVATPGTCLFVPVGYWHEVEMLEDSLAINVSVMAERWIDVIGAAIRRALLAHPELRGQVYGALSDETSPLHARAERGLKVAVETCSETLRLLTVEDIGLAGDHSIVRWHGDSAARRLEETAEGVRLMGGDGSPLSVMLDPQLTPLVRKAIGFRGGFGLDDLKALAPGISVRTLRDFMAEMKARGFFEG